MKKYEKEGNKELATYYDQRQLVQKVFLNSIYGVLGLSIFRFYDLDNALAVTSTSQDIIKTSSKYVSSLYTKAKVPPKSKVWLDRYWAVTKADAKRRKVEMPPRPTPDDHCVYIDTDSVYFSAVELLPPGPVDEKQFTIDIARDMEKKLNTFYNVMAKKLFFCNTHRLVIKGESVVQTGIWIAKKRYALKKVYDLEVGMDVDKLVVKGLDVVRSTFPPAFAKFMKGMMKDILDKKPKEVIDKMILNLYTELPTFIPTDIMRNTGVKEVTEVDDVSEKQYVKFPHKAAAHVKAAIIYNRYLRNHGLDKNFEPIRSGDKIKWTYLKKNPLQLETIALKGYNDPPQITAFVSKYIDHKRVFEADLSNKLESFYVAMGWGLLPTEINQNAFAFFKYE
jgi:DNA polymerase elongation subunit (family B)